MFCEILAVMFTITAVIGVYYVIKGVREFDQALETEGYFEFQDKVARFDSPSDQPLDYAKEKDNEHSN